MLRIWLIAIMGCWFLVDLRLLFPDGIEDVLVFGDVRRLCQVQGWQLVQLDQQGPLGVGPGDGGLLLLGPLLLLGYRLEWDDRLPGCRVHVGQAEQVGGVLVLVGELIEVPPDLVQVLVD